ncbi:MAG TPA: isochorismatase family cysteine hydrolase [Casimicrobiaceae bacterium]
MDRAVLIVVDMLNDFFERSHALSAQRSRLVARTNALVRVFRCSGQPIIWIRQEFAPDLHDAFLAMRANNVSITIAGTAGCDILSELERHPRDLVLVKKRYSAFFGTELDAELSTLRPEVVVVAGVNTHACVRMTAIDAYQRDYDVIVAGDCVASSDPEHHDVTLRYLEGNIARVLATDHLITVLGAAA